MGKPAQKVFGKKQTNLVKHSLKNDIPDHKKQIQQKYRFVLKALPHMTSPKYDNIKANFEPQKIITGVYEQCIPIFNMDKCYYTDAFILKNKKEYYMFHPSIQKKKFAQKVKQKMQYINYRKNKPSQLPISTHNYCQICSQQFINNYYEHIYQLKHLQKMKQKQANKYINQLISIYRGYKQQCTIAQTDKNQSQPLQNNLINMEKQKKINKPIKKMHIKLKALYQNYKKQRK